jgi:phosphatidylserine synthase
MVYFIQKAMDDTFVGGSSSDITVTLWFAISGVMALSMVLFFQFTKIKDLNSQRTIQKGIFIGWAIIAIAMIIFIPSYIYFILLTIIASLVSLLSSITLKHKITGELQNKKETLTEKEIYLLQKLAGVKNPKK